MSQVLTFVFFLIQTSLRSREGKNDDVSGKLTVSLTLLGRGAQREVVASAEPGNPVSTTESPNDGLPDGWEARRDASLRTYYVNHNSRMAQWNRPRASAAGPAPETPSVAPSGSSSRAAPFMHTSSSPTIMDSSIAPPLSAPTPAVQSAPPAASSAAASSSRRHRGNSVDRTSSSGAAAADSSRERRRGDRRRGTRDGGQENATDVTTAEALIDASSHPRRAPDAISEEEDPLPAGWEQRRGRDGRIFFIDHNRRRTQWEDPRTGRPAPENATAEGILTNDHLGPLPRGWEQRLNTEGRLYFVDHANRHTQWEDPRLTTPAKAADPPKYIRDYQHKLAAFRRRVPQVDHRHKLELRVRRSHLFEDAFEKILEATPEKLVKRLWITFVGEEGLDYGGLAREFFFLLSREMFNPYYCLFEYSASDNYTLQISANSDVNPDHLRYFYFIGRVIGMAVHHDKFLDAFFIPSFYKRILGTPITLEDLASIEPDKYNSFAWMLGNPISGVLFETFSVNTEKFGEMVVHDLKPGGAKIEVTDKNKREYVDLYVKWRLTRGTEEQMAQVLRGFHEIVSAELISVFEPSELEYLVGGLSEINIDDWQRNTVYKNYESTDKVVRWFWVCVRGMDHEQQARLLQFVTGTSRVPATGFKDLWGMLRLVIFFPQNYNF